MIPECFFHGVPTSEDYPNNYKTPELTFDSDLSSMMATYNGGSVISPLELRSADLSGWAYDSPPSESSVGPPPNNTISYKALLGFDTRSLTP
jgi:hypothetical protein